MIEKRFIVIEDGELRMLVSAIATFVLACFAVQLDAQENAAQQSGVAAQIAPADPAGIFTASKRGDLGAITDCLGEGIDIDEQDAKHGVTPLSWAAVMGHADAVDLLLSEGADVNARNRDGASALHAACFFGQPEAAERLMDQGADVNAETNDGARPIDVLKADWEITQEIAGILDIDLDEERVAAGRSEAAALLRQRGAKEGGNAFFVLSILFGCVVGGLAIVGVIVWIVHQHEKKRTEAMRAIAADIGLNFSATKHEALLAKLQSFTLFNKGRSRKMKNVMTAETDLAQLTIFDYQYTTGGGDSSRTHHQTVIAMESESLCIPEFTLRPEGFFDKVGATLGFQDIDFADHPEFSRLFVLKGKNEEAIRHFFDAEMLEMFTHRQGMTINCGPGVFIYLRGGRKKPEEIQGFMAEGYDVFSAFEKRLQGSQANPRI